MAGLGMAGEPDNQRPSSLDAFSKRLDAARSARGGAEAERAQAERDQQGRAMGQGIRLASELIAAMIVGTGLGFLLDLVAPTGPFGLLGGIFIGFAAGVMNVARAMKASGPDNTENAGAPTAPAMDEADK